MVGSIWCRAYHEPARWWLWASLSSCGSHEEPRSYCFPVLCYLLLPFGHTTRFCMGSPQRLPLRPRNRRPIRHRPASPSRWCSTADDLSVHCTPPVHPSGMPAHRMAQHRSSHGALAIASLTAEPPTDSVAPRPHLPCNPRAHRRGCKPSCGNRVANIMKREPRRTYSFFRSQPAVVFSRAVPQCDLQFPSGLLPHAQPAPDSRC